MIMTVLGCAVMVLSARPTNGNDASDELAVASDFRSKTTVQVADGIGVVTGGQGGVALRFMENVIESQKMFLPIVRLLIGRELLD